MWFSIFSGLTIGFLGSFHCIGMCGPIALSLPVQSKSSQNNFWAILLYNTGRTFTYGVLGLVLGFISYRFYLVGYQQIVSILAGVFILLFLMLSYFFPTNKTFLGRFYYQIQRLLGMLLTVKKNLFTYFLIGVLNGLLPCGLVYLGIAHSLTTTNAIHGALLMLSFGLGTVPFMILLMYMRDFVSIRTRTIIKKWMPLLICLMAILLILRGLNLGIPFISPALNIVDKSNAVQCH